MLLALILGVATSYLYGAIRVNGREVLISKSARIQIAVTAGVYLLLQAVSIWLDHYSTLTERMPTPHHRSGVHRRPRHHSGSRHPRRCRTLRRDPVLHHRVRRALALPLVGTALLIISRAHRRFALPVGGPALPGRPERESLETPYIQRNIDLTRKAFGVDAVKETNYDATTDAEPGALRSDADTTASIRIIDPAVVTDTYKQLEQFRQYYQFPAKMDVDRYTSTARARTPWWPCATSTSRASTTPRAG